MYLITTEYSHIKINKFYYTIHLPRDMKVALPCE